MSINEIYINTYLNNISNTLEFYVERIRMIGKKNTEYYFCIYKIINIIDEVEFVLKKTKTNSVGINRFYNLLVLLKEYHIPQVDEMLEKYHYVALFDMTYNNIIQSIESDSFDNQYLWFIDFMLEYEIIPVDDQELLHNYIIKSVLVREQTVSLSAFKKMIKSFTLKQLYTGGHVISKRSSDENECCYRSGSIVLDERKIEEMYSTGNYSLLLDIFAGCRMAYYAKKMRQKKCDELTLKMVKDEALSTIIFDYLSLNKDKMPFYVESKLYAFDKLYSLFGQMNISFFGNKDPYLKEKEKLKSLLDDDKRYTEEGCTTLDSLFNQKINYLPELISIYPVLSDFFVISENGLLVGRTN